MDFNYGIKSPEINEKEYFFIFEKNKILIKNENNKVEFLSIEDLEELEIELENKYLIDRYRNEYYYLGDFKEDIYLTGKYEFREVRSTFDEIEENVFWILGRAFHISHWNGTNKFCSNCGSTTIQNSKQRSIDCPSCNSVFYPRISPAVIVAIIKDDKILLAQNASFKFDFYSVLAGFLEPGETLEECVQREVKEEVGIEVTNIKYFGSQPWPFPDSIMVGFTAEYLSGDIDEDRREIFHADWFSVDNLPKIPSSISISRKLIDWFIEENS